MAAVPAGGAGEEVDGADAAVPLSIWMRCIPPLSVLSVRVRPGVRREVRGGAGGAVAADDGGGIGRGRCSRWCRGGGRRRSAAEHSRAPAVPALRGAAAVAAVLRCCAGQGGRAWSGWAVGYGAAQLSWEGAMLGSCSAPSPSLSGLSAAAAAAELRCSSAGLCPASLSVLRVPSKVKGGGCVFHASLPQLRRARHSGGHTESHYPPSPASSPSSLTHPTDSCALQPRRPVCCVLSHSSGAFVPRSHSGVGEFCAARAGVSSAAAAAVSCSPRSQRER